MSPTNHPGHIIPQDIEPGDVSESFGMAEPYTLAEIEDLLYGDDRPASQRLARLRELREQSQTRESGDFGDHDPAASLTEIDRAIDELSATMANSDELDDAYAGLETSADTDPADRLDTLSPDDVEARQAVEGDDDFYEEDEDFSVLDEAEWAEGDDFRPEKGVH